MADLTPEAVRALRRRLGLTQAAFAARLAVSTQAVSFWERGTRTPTGLYARALRDLLAAAEPDPTPDPACAASAAHTTAWAGSST